MTNLKKLADQIHGLDEVGGCELMEVEAQWLQQATDEIRQAADLIEQQQREIKRLREQLDIQTKRGDMASGAIDTALEAKGESDE